MKAKQILDAAKINLNIKDDDSDALLLYCLKNVLNELSTEFIPVYAQERITVEDGKFDLTKLEKVPVKITSIVTDKEILRFSETPFGIIIKPKYSGEVNVTYRYLPLVETAEDEIPYGETALRALSFGLSAEYCLVSGLDSEAEVWDVRYKDAAKEAAYAKREYRVKPRAWY